MTIYTLAYRQYRIKGLNCTSMKCDKQTMRCKLKRIVTIYPRFYCIWSGTLYLCRSLFCKVTCCWISANQAASVGAAVWILFRAIIFLAVNNVSCKNWRVHLFIPSSGNRPNRHCLGSSDTGEPIWSCRNWTTCDQYPWIRGHCQMIWSKVPTEMRHLGHISLQDGQNLARCCGVRYALWVM